MTKRIPAVSDIKTRTALAQRELADTLIEAKTPELRKAASKAQNFMVVKSISGLPAFGRMSFDGKPEHLRGIDRIVWDWLEQEGLNPSFFVTTGGTAWFGGEEVGGAETYHMLADWSGHEEIGEPTLLVQELRALRDAGVARVAAEEIEKIKVAIDKAVREGEDWTTVHYFGGSAKPSQLLPFDGKKESLTGVARMIWAYLDKNGLAPRLYSVKIEQVWIPGIGHINYGDKGRGFRIAACWFDKAESDSASSSDGETSSVVDPQSPPSKPSATDKGSKRRRS